MSWDRTRSTAIPCIPLVANQTLDDVVIFAYVRHIDGPEGILGFATPYYTRDSDTTTVSGCMTFDEDDLAMLATKGLLQATITHEMGHVLGIGTLWSFKRMTVGTCDPNTGVRIAQSLLHRGLRAPGLPYRAWCRRRLDRFARSRSREMARASTEHGTVIRASRSSCNELMTGYIDPISNPLSAVSASFLRDLGLQVNDLAVDPYTVPWGLPALRMKAPGGVQLNEMQVNPPIHMMDRNGRTTRIIER